MEHDTSDILGHKTLPTLNRDQRASFPFSMTGALFTSFLLWGIYAVGNRLWRRILQWRERSYRLATRRRHGIPDSDLRPFNVAYAEAMNRAREEENRGQAKPRPAALRPHASLPPQREMQLDQNLRQRQGVPQRPDPGMRSTIIPVPGRYTTESYEPRIPTAETSIASDDHHLRQNRVHPTTKGLSKPGGLARQGGFLDISDAENLSDGEGKKRALDAEPDEEHEAKKTRVEGDELIDGDEDAEFEVMFPPKRGSKRGMQDEADSEEPSPSKKSRGKRARKVSQEKRQLTNDNMDVDDEEADQVTELKSATRGKKRDRAEAGSTFGGDDGDSAAELELEDDAKHRRHRKRRTVAKRKSEASYIRGKQRTEDGEDDVSDASSNRSSPDGKASRKKKSKRPSHIDRRDRERRDSKSDVSMDESTTSTRSKVRSIGDEWESNGVKYKIGLNGQRLRQALVKKARQKFVMPKDSQHPDRDVNLQVYVESWLTEEEYVEAKAQHLLAWQDPPPATRPEGTEKLSLNIANHVASPRGQPTGKNLLWSQSTASTPTMSPASQSPAETPSEISRQRSFRHSLAGTPVGFTISPFTQSQIPTVKRIASNSRAVSLSTSIHGSPGLTDSTNGRVPHKVFSKWEKQELEAQAMMKIREATRKKEMEKEAKLKEERERAERDAAERQRLERERQERERQERERQERERAAAAAAEAERKAKEAAERAKAASAPTAAPPQITVTAPPASQPATAPSSGGSVPNFFAQPASSTPKADASSTSGGFSFTAKPSTTPGGYAPVAVPQPTTTTPALSFNGPSNTSVQKAGGTFNFTAPSSSTGGEQKKEGGGSSLSSRLGSQSAEAPKAQGINQPASGTPLFSFPKPGETSSSSTTQPGNPFGSGASASSANSTTGTGATTTPKFNFNVNSNKPSSPAPTSTGNNANKAPISAFSSGSSSLSGALGGGASGTSGDAQKAGAPMFSFKTPSTPASASTGANVGGAGAGSTTPSTTPVAAPKFNFVPTATSSSSPFGGAQQQQQQRQGKESEKKSTFGGAFGSSTTPANSPFGGASSFGSTTTPSAFGGASSTPSVFGTTSTPSAFGSTDAPSAFGGAKATSAFGASPFGATPAQTSSVFGGGNSGGAVMGDTKPATDGNANKPTFGFGNAGAPSTNMSSTPNFSFGVTSTPNAGGSTTPASTPASGSAGGGNGFTFKFGPPSTTTPQSSPFGAPATSGQTSLFGGGVTGTGTSVFGGNTFGSAPKQS